MSLKRPRSESFDRQDGAGPSSVALATPPQEFQLGDYQELEVSNKTMKTCLEIYFNKDGVLTWDSPIISLNKVHGNWSFKLSGTEDYMTQLIVNLHQDDPKFAVQQKMKATVYMLIDGADESVQMSQLITKSATEFKSGLFESEKLNKCGVNLEVGMKIEYKRLESVKIPVGLTEHWKSTKPFVKHFQDGLTDFTFHVKGKDFDVHRSIVAKSCEAMKDAMVSKTDKTIMDIDNPIVFETILHFCYGNKQMFEQNVEQFSNEVYRAADIYGMTDVKNYCQDVIVKKCMDKNPDDVFDAYESASMNKLHGFKEYCWEIIKFDIFKKFTSHVPANIKNVHRSYKKCQRAASYYNEAKDYLEQSMTYPSQSNEDFDAICQDADQTDAEYAGLFD